MSNQMSKDRVRFWIGSENYHRQNFACLIEVWKNPARHDHA